MKAESGGIRVLIQPRDGAAPVRALMDGAQSSIKVKMFTFDSATLIEGLVTAVARGVDVHVMLNASRSSGTRANDATFETLQAAGVKVAWTSPRFVVTHEKSMVVDGKLALIATFNFCDKYFTQTRDYGVVVTEPSTVREVDAGFETDWAHGRMELPDDSPLLWSSRNSRQGMAQFIDGATRSLLIQHPKFSDAAILDRLLAANERGVHVRVLCGGRHGISLPDMLDTFSALRILKRNGCAVRKQQQLRLHAKLVIVDHERALVGSMNIDRSAFDLRRELGILISDTAAVAALRHQFDADWDAAHGYEAPDPLALHLAQEIALPADVDLDHE